MLSPPQLGERTQARFGRVPIFGNCIGMRRHLAARENINPGLAGARTDLDAVLHIRSGWIGECTVIFRM